MKRYEFQTKNIVSEIKRSNEYNHYHRVLKKVMQDKTLYDKICQFRKKRLVCQLEQGDNADRKMDELREEYEGILSQSLVMEFLVAEQRLSNMGRNITELIYEALELELEFLND